VCTHGAPAARHRLRNATPMRPTPWSTGRSIHRPAQSHDWYVSTAFTTAGTSGASWEAWKRPTEGGAREGEGRRWAGAAATPATLAPLLCCKSSGHICSWASLALRDI
jgi:hypothetical protein